MKVVLATFGSLGDLHPYLAVGRELRALLGDGAYAARAAAIGEHVRAEAGPEAAADALEALLSSDGVRESRARAREPAPATPSRPA